ncbi:dioxygenase [Lacihabitans sp. LS3-19]|uniref:dioxygenase family protein n=1 Tax=Lacihabitans sp. LS3-19 TaxID=2487335 RepID=UPI0020CC949B|nr:class III extradiol ring-cleavage dioxygenase [Lacihabitans sp. LS3-19]MCP9770455.1 dioxygenase [Lacihabitans sp. LS3-19]
MKRNDFNKSLLSLAAMGTLSSFKNFTDTLQVQSNRMPVLFTSHGSPMDIPLSKEERPFWDALYNLGKDLQGKYEIKAALVVSAHWCAKQTMVNISPQQEQIYDYYGFPKHYYDVKYKAKGAPEIAHEVTKIIPSVHETTDWGLDHGAWPMLMHLFPEANIPVFQMSISYYDSPQYHYDLGKQLKSLREKGVLIIGSGSLIHNLQILGPKMRSGDMSPFGWEPEYDAFIKKQIDDRNYNNIINYETSHKLGKLAAPTPDHFVPVLYSLGLTDPKDELRYFYEGKANIPAFSERSFILS